MIPNRVAFSARALFDGKSPTKHLITIGGKIFDGRDKAMAGEIVAYRVNASAMRACGDNPAAALGAGDATATYCHFYRDGRLSETVQLTAAMPGQDNLLIIDHLYVFPNYRGHDLGLVAIANTISVWADNAIALLKAFPLQLATDTPPQDRYKYQGFEKDPQTAFKKLMAHYRRLGFAQVEDMKYMALGPCLHTKLFNRFCLVSD
jgi:GNAT superfamily N-acetyltransferase